ncbi:MAG: dipeptidyl-peptidase 4 [Fimbriimonadaceae bacterium]|nr:dipeptidyl-peptidase 4 [Fimbriimonadaceae bacterium]
MPRYDLFERMRRELPSAVQRPDVHAVWDPSGKRVYYTRGGKSFAFDITSRQEIGSKPPESTSAQKTDRRPRPERGRQFTSATSPDGKLKAFQRDRNVYLSNADGTNELAITTQGSVEKRIKYGVASWVYGEELGVREAIWWSPDSTMVAYYKFDEGKVKDYYMAYNQLDIQDTLNVEPYPKAGADNPSVDIFVYDLATKQSKQLGVHFDGGNGPDVGTYVYDVRWSPDGKELLFNRCNRKQNTMELCAGNPKSGECRVILRETSKTWTDNSPSMVYLEETRPGARRFLWRSERNGFYNWYLYDLSGKLYNPVTKGTFDAEQIVRLDPAQGLVYYMARDGELPYLLQLHRARLDGSDDRRLSDPKFNHTVSVSPDGLAFVDTQETMDTPPVVNLVGLDGKIIQRLGESDLTKFNELGLKKAERFSFTAADGKTTCYGTLYKPSDFSPAKKYPLIVDVYGGPDSSAMSFQSAERFQIMPAYAELGFLVASIDGRGTQGRGRAFKDAVYEKLGVVEIDDQAAGAKALASRPYVDPNRVGIFGTSYGGYASAMAILRHPEVFKVAVSSSPVTDWRNYDTIYTERYMGLPWESENRKGYEAGSAMTYAKTFKGNLFLYYGTADNNVHPANTFQLVEALQEAGKPFELMAGPDQGHSQMSFSKILEYFMDKLIIGKG